MSAKGLTTITVIGFSLFFLGMMSLTLSLMDIRISFLSWITDSFGRFYAFLIHIFMVIIGLVLVVATRGNFSGEDPIPKNIK